MLQFFLVSVMGLAIVIAAALMFTLLRLLVRRLLG